MSETAGSFIEGREAIVDAWRQILLGLPQGDARELCWVDPDFNDWPLDEPAVIDALTLWARPNGRRLRMVGQDFDAAARRHPRLATWRRAWSHRFEALQPIESERAELPTLLLAGSQAIDLLDRDRWRARHVRGAADLRAFAERCEAIAQRCEPAWPSTTLGL